jgi:hypothetical protein
VAKAPVEEVKKPAPVVQEKVQEKTEKPAENTASDVSPEPEKKEEKAPVTLESLLQDIKNGISLDLLKKFESIDICKEKPDYVDLHYYDTRRKETREVQFRDENF